LLAAAVAVTAPAAIIAATTTATKVTTTANPVEAEATSEGVTIGRRAGPGTPSPSALILNLTASPTLRQQ
jgi:hypothetical protein